LSNTIDDITDVSLRYYLKPSIHILGTSLLGLAKEGALKIREVVLNHTEGYDAAEFKHGPNTILGRNTLYSLIDLEFLFEDMCDFFKELLDDDLLVQPEESLAMKKCLDMLKVLRFKKFKTNLGDNGATENEARSLVGHCYQLLRKHVHLEHYFSNYPLIFVCPPEERDKRITISQIHTHKIRGADVVLIAHEDEDLQKAIEGKPASLKSYYAKYVRIPKMFDPNLFVFGAVIVLQLLAFKMSVAKMKYLNRIQVEKHGVHPDVPKNVSKSITVD
jgi:glucosamine 6-phosphate synthetase-like amidotransferase/phosphosugar isomerase protein